MRTHARLAWRQSSRSNWAIAAAKSTRVAAVKDLWSCVGTRLGKDNRSAVRQTRQERECRTL